MTIQKLILPAFTLSAFLITSVAMAIPRDSMTQSKIDKHLMALAEVCGCPLAIEVDWESFGGKNESRKVADTVDSFVAAANSQCSNAAEKQKFCNHVDGLRIAFSKKGAAVELIDKRIVATTDGQVFVVEQDFVAVVKEIG